MKAAPANVAAPTVDFSGRDLIISWPAAVGANNYRLTLNGTRTYEVPNRTYTYTFAENVAQNTTPDPTISYSIVAVDAFAQTSASPRTGTATNGAPAAPSAVSVTGYFSTMAIVVTATEPEDFLYYRYRVIQTNPSAANVTFNSTTALRVYSIDTAATYQVGVRVVDAFNQTSSETLSAAVVIDTLTLEDLREDAKYSSIDGTSNAALKAALADNSFVTNGISTSVAQGTWAWWRFERPYLERYETITFMSNYNTSLDWYIRTSSNGTTWEYFSGPVTGSRVLTAVASEAAARTAAVNILTLGYTAANSRVELPSINQARYVELWTKVDVGSTGLHAVREYYPRRLVQSDDIEAESIRGINISGATITGDRLVANTITATQIAASTITATQIAANTITATEIAASTITATQIAANAITATQIASNAITTAKIAADAVTADKISVTTLSAITANLGTITAGIITGATIQTATSGARIELTSANGLRSFNSAGTLQTQIRTDNGRLTWGGSAAFLDASGMQLALPTSGGPPSAGLSPQRILWTNANGEVDITGYTTGATGTQTLELSNVVESNANGDISLFVMDGPGASSPKNMSVTLEAVNNFGGGVAATIQAMATFSGLDQIYLRGDVYDGISFGNTSASASKLDYYQEGTWTVTIVGTTTTGAATYITPLGRYVRVGKYVFVTCEVEWTGGTGAGFLRIRGLPFTVLSTGVFSSAAIYSSNVASPAGTVLQGGFLNNSVDIFLASVPTGGGAAAALAYDAAGGLWVSGWYEV